MKRWYSHRYHTTLAHRIVFATIPLVPRFLHPPIAAVTAACTPMFKKVDGALRQAVKVALWGERILATGEAPDLTGADELGFVVVEDGDIYMDSHLPDGDVTPLAEAIEQVDAETARSRWLPAT